MDKVNEVFLYFRIVGAASGTFLASILGGWDILLQTLVYMTILDFMTGVLASIYHKQLSSKIGSKGIIKKAGVYCIVALAFMLDNLFGTELLRNAAIGFYIATEGISILENWGKMNLPLPAFIREVLIQLKERSDMKKKEA